jgi:hypothetical protein
MLSVIPGDLDGSSLVRQCRRERLLAQRNIGSAELEIQDRRRCAGLAGDRGWHGVHRQLGQFPFTPSMPTPVKRNGRLGPKDLG